MGLYLYIGVVSLLGTPEILADIQTRMVKLESLQEKNAEAIGNMASNVNRLIDKLDHSDDIAKEAYQRVRSAQHQINDIKGTMKWLIGTTLTIVGLFFTAIGFLWKVVGGS